MLYQSMSCHQMMEAKFKKSKFTQSSTNLYLYVTRHSIRRLAYYAKKKKNGRFVYLVSVYTPVQTVNCVSRHGGKINVTHSPVPTSQAALNNSSHISHEFIKLQELWLTYFAPDNQTRSIAIRDWLMQTIMFRNKLLKARVKSGQRCNLVYNKSFQPERPL